MQLRTGQTYGTDAIASEGVHHLFSFLVQKEARHVDGEQVLVALFKRNFHCFTQALTEALALTRQFRDIQKHGI